SLDACHSGPGDISDVGELMLRPSFVLALCLHQSAEAFYRCAGGSHAFSWPLGFVLTWACSASALISARCLSTSGSETYWRLSSVSWIAWNMASPTALEKLSLVFSCSNDILFSMASFYLMLSKKTQ